MECLVHAGLWVLGFLRAYLLLGAPYLLLGAPWIAVAAMPFLRFGIAGQLIQLFPHLGYDKESMAKKNGSMNGDSDLASLQKVRDLLLDSDRRESNDRMARMERLLRAEIDRSASAQARELAKMNAALSKRLDGLESELGAIEESQAAKLDSAKKGLRGRIDKVEADSKLRAKGLRERVSEVTRKLREEASEREAKVLDKLNEGLEVASEQGTSRHRLAAMLAEVANQLAEDSAGS